MSRTDPRPNYGSGRRVRADGYVDLWYPGHSLARSDGYVFEHRIVLYDSMVTVPPGFEVHHIDGNRANNRLDNLAVVTSAAHHRLHHPVNGINARRLDKKAAMGTRTCAACGEDITNKRIDARFCSDRCQVGTWKRAHR